MDLSNWTLDAIRSSDFDGIAMNWLEERRSEWVGLLALRLRYFLSGASFVLICDEEREWFERYFLCNINKPNLARPFLPFISLRSLYPRVNEINIKDDLPLLQDLLNITLPNGYIYFYVGKGSSKLSLLAKNSDNSYMWLFDEQAQNSFYLNSQDGLLDIKLLSLFKLFDKSLSEILLGRVNI